MSVVHHVVHDPMDVREPHIRSETAPRIETPPVDPPRRDRGHGRAFAAVLLIFLAVVLAACAFRPWTGGVKANGTNRERLELGYGYDSDNVVDELGWLSSEAGVSRGLQKFYDVTGVTPYVVLVSRPEVTRAGPEAENEYAEEQFDELCATEGAVLFMYFDSGVEGEDGNGYLIIGKQAGPIMDAEAIEIFWNYADQLWYDDISEDDMFIQMFNKTAGRIMQRTTTGADVAKWFLVVLAIACGTAGVVLVIRCARQAQAERAAETERILSTPLQRPDAAESDGGVSGDDLLDKYSDPDE